MKFLSFKSRRATASLAVLLAAVMSFSAPVIAAPADAASKPAVGAGTPSSPNMPVMLQRGTGAHSQDIVAVEVSGTVERQSEGSDVWTAVRKGDKFDALDKIRTGPDGSARIEFDGKIRIQILSDSELTVEEAHRENDRVRQTLLKLDIGRIKADVDKLGPGSTFKVKTPTAVSAVRGTTFYLSVIRFAQGLQGILTNLYVDKGKVDFAALEDEINSLLVEAFHTSSADGSGKTTESKELTPEEREALIQAFEQAFKNAGNPQTGVETGALPGGSGANLPGGQNDAAFRDALEKLINELIETRNETSGIEDENGEPFSVLGALKLVAILVSEGLPLSGGFDYDAVNEGFDYGIVSDDRTHTLNETLAATDLATVNEGLESLQDKREVEKQQLRDSLDSILDNQKFLEEDAQQEKQFDAQTGKVFTDVHGNRVRTDQYVYHEAGSDQVRLVSLTLRTGEYQPGVTSMEFGVSFNQPLAEGVLLRDLPWNDYLNVVTDEEFNSRYAYGTNYLNLGQFIVHESAGSGAAQPELYPQSFYAEFRNPAGDKIRFSENYSTPTPGTFYTDDSEEETMSLWYQGRISEITTIEGYNFESPVTYGREVVNNGNYTSIQNVGLNLSYGIDLPQSADFAEAGEGISGLQDPDGFDYFRNHPANNDGNPDNDVHPAFFEDQLEDGSRLLGIFIPIDNLGQPIDAAGFKVEGLRDLVSPNPEVVGGQYNLEAIFSYHQNLYGDDGPTSSEVFRIDAIITPEIFTPYGIRGGSDLFPARLVSDDHDDRNNA